MKKKERKRRHRREDRADPIRSDGYGNAVELSRTRSSVCAAANLRSEGGGE